MGNKKYAHHTERERESKVIVRPIINRRVALTVAVALATDRKQKGNKLLLKHQGRCYNRAINDLQRRCVTHHSSFLPFLFCPLISISKHSWLFTLDLDNFNVLGKYEKKKRKIITSRLKNNPKIEKNKIK